MLFRFYYPAASAGCFQVAPIPKEIVILINYPLRSQKPGFYMFLRCDRVFSKKSVSGLLSLISICSFTRHFIAVEHHLAAVASWLIKEK
jgi:hypothetical protein